MWGVEKEEGKKKTRVALARLSPSLFNRHTREKDLHSVAFAFLLFRRRVSCLTQYTRRSTWAHVRVYLSACLFLLVLCVSGLHYGPDSVEVDRKWTA